MRKILTGVLLLQAGAMTAAAWFLRGSEPEALKELLGAELLVTVLTGIVLLWAEYQKEKQERILSELREQEWKAELGFRRRTAEERLAGESRELQRILKEQLEAARAELQGRGAGCAESLTTEKPQKADEWDSRCCANPMADLVLKEKQKEYADRHIKFAIRLYIPLQTKISAYELCSIFTNDPRQNCHQQFCTQQLL